MTSVLLLSQNATLFVNSNEARVREAVGTPGWDSGTGEEEWWLICRSSHARHFYLTEARIHQSKAEVPLAFCLCQLGGPKEVLC
ncbi:hypothetical protein E2C01_015494 [Portunus trituberculatus]|uniref:Uncharacterized protein n=1 Tax=Portunus trituberculatus TaxID=210409 RepID=A0A5B7DM09_PORTR|nr:hypothetical protein [Portunus trituberculatus]